MTMPICPQNGPYGPGPSHTPEPEPEVAPAKAKKLDYSVVTQRVDCVFGHDHYITVKIQEDKTLDTIYTTCSADKAETEGLILLGTPAMKTCLGYMDVFLQHVKGANVYNLPTEYRNTFLCKAGEPIAISVGTKNAIRKAEAAAEVKRQEDEKSEGLIQRRLREFIAKSVGNKKATKFSIVREEDGHYTFNILSEQTFNYRTQAHEGGQPVPLADRRNGEWVVRHGWDTNLETYKVTGRWGGQCEFCGVDGNSYHDEKKGHIRKTNNAIFKAMQASSQAGIRIARDGVLDKNGDPVEFKYRANSKNLIGVKFAPAPFDYSEKEYADAENTSY